MSHVETFPHNVGNISLIAHTHTHEKQAHTHMLSLSHTHTHIHTPVALNTDTQSNHQISESLIDSSSGLELKRGRALLINISVSPLKHTSLCYTLYSHNGVSTMCLSHDLILLHV